MKRLCQCRKSLKVNSQGENIWKTYQGGIRLWQILKGEKGRVTVKTGPKKCQHHQHKIMTLALCSFDEVNQSGSGGERVGWGISGTVWRSLRGGVGTITNPPVALYSAQKSNPNLEPPPQSCQIHNQYSSLKEQKRPRYKEGVNKATEHISINNNTLQRNRPWNEAKHESCKGKKLSDSFNPSTNFCCSAGRASFHGNDISLHYIFFFLC